MSNNVCPWWLGYMLINPVRRLMHNPGKILSSYVKENMKVIDIGPGMGYFSLPMAKMVGSTGKVFCIDVQEQMLSTLAKRAAKANLDGIITPRKCSFNSLMIEDLKEKIDFVLAFAVVHEVPDQKRLLVEIKEVLKPGGKFLLAEPSGHVSINDFEHTVQLAEEIGFSVLDHPKISHSNAVLLSR